MIAIIGSDGKIKKLWVSSGLIEIEPGNFVPDTATITINGDEQLLVDNPVFSISTSIPDGDYGDITIGGSGTTMTINNGVITTAMFEASATAPKAVILDPGAEVNGVVFDGSGNVMTEAYLNLLQGVGSAIKSVHFMGAPVGNTGIVLSNQRLNFQAIYIPKAATLTGIWWIQTTQGNYTEDNENRIGLNEISGGTTTLVASCADDGALWKSAPGLIKKAFSTPYPAASGWYFISALWCRSAQVTAPAIAGYATINAAYSTLDLADSVKLSCHLNFQTSLGSGLAMSGNTNNASPYLMGVY